MCGCDMWVGDVGWIIPLRGNVWVGDVWGRG